MIGNKCVDCGIVLTSENVHPCCKGRWKKNLCKKCYNARRQNYPHQIRMEIFNLLGDKCVHCGFSDWRALQIDHVNGGGTKERRNTRTHFSNNLYYYYKHVLEQIKGGSKDYQLLCSNCNWIKRWENREFTQPIERAKSVYQKRFEEMKKSGLKCFFCTLNAEIFSLNTEKVPIFDISKTHTLLSNYAHSNFGSEYGDDKLYYFWYRKGYLRGYCRHCFGLIYGHSKEFDNILSGKDKNRP